MTAMPFLYQPLDTILGQEAHVRILRALLMQGRPLPLARLAVHARMSAKRVRQALRLLEQMGSIEAVGSSRAKLYGIRAGSSLVYDMERLFVAENCRKDEMLCGAKQATNLPGVLGAWLFGNIVGRRNTRRGSLDIAIIVDAQMIDLAGVANEVSDRIARGPRQPGFSPSIVSMTCADLSRLKNERDPLWDAFLHNAHLLNGASPQDLLEYDPLAQ